MASGDPQAHKPSRSEEARARTAARFHVPPTFAESALADAARHFAGDDLPAEDHVERWGRRIGRALSLAGCIALAIYLYLTYVR